MRLDFISPGYQGRSANIDAQRMVNLYPEIDPGAKEKKVMSLVGVPGFVMFAHVSGNTIRGMHVFNNLIYLVAGNKLYSVNNAGILSSALGTLNTFSSRVSMADNSLSPTGGNQLIIVDGSYGYIHNVSTGVFSQIAAAGWPSTGADTAAFIDGYFIVSVGGGLGQFQVSGLYDGTAWNSLDKSTANSDSGNLMAVINSHRDLWLLCEYAAEVWYDAGAGNPPFVKNQSVQIETGIAARWSLAKGDNTLFWLAQDRSGRGFVVKASGYGTPRKVSTPAIDYQISTYPSLSDAVGFCYTQEGHTFYCLSFPSANATLIYDESTDLWHERSSYSTGRWRADSYINFNGRHLVGDFSIGNIYEMKTSAYSDQANNEPILRMRTCRHISEDMKPLFFHRLQVDMETGTGDENYILSSYAPYLADGTYTADGSVTPGGDILPGTSVNPQCALSWSDDGGHTWSNEYQAAMGRQGEYKTRVVWRRLGRSRNRIFRLTVADPVKTIILGASMEVTRGRV